MPVVAAAVAALTVYAVGDIARCAYPDPRYSGAADTAATVAAGLAADPQAVVLTLGDHTYPRGTAQEFRDCYAPTWGRFKDRTWPAPGNHEYYTPKAAPYFDYFGVRAGRGYYSLELGGWHVISLDSNLDPVKNAAAHAAQLAWLRADLAAHPARCTLAFWHHPLYSSGGHGSIPTMRDAWELLQQAGAELVLSGHDHDYERFAPQDAHGRSDPARGMRQFVVGTGGAGPRQRVLPLTLSPNGVRMQPRLSRLIPLLLALAGLPAAAQAPAPATADGAATLPRIAFDKTVLPNGLEVILVEDHRLPIVAVNIWYHVGPANEAPGLTGFAHLFEHMMFAATRHLPRGLADRLLEGAGATDSNGSTDYDRTNYYDTVPSNQLELALWVHADRMGYLLDVLDQTALNNQQDVVRNERRQSVENRPYGIVEEALNHALFPKNHPYYASVIGSHADIQNAKLNDVRDFFRRYYGPNNASIVIAGDIDKAKTRALVAKYFGSFRRSAPVARPQVATPPIVREQRITVADRVELPRVYMAWLTPPAYQPGDAELAVTAQILAGGKAGRLYKSLVYGRQIAQDVAASQNAYALASTFMIDATARPGTQPADLESAIDAELKALREVGPSDAEVERARNTIETAMLTSIEKLGGAGLANQLNQYNQYTGDPGYLSRDLERLRRVGAADVRRAAQAWLQPNARVVVEGVPGTPELGPDASAPLSTPAPSKAKRGAAAAGINRDQAWRRAPPQPGPAPKFTLPGGDAFKLPNGLTVIHHYNPALPLVSAELVVKSGSDANPDALPGLAGFTAQMLEEGSATRSAPRIADEIAQLGAFLGSDSTADASTVSLLALRATFPQALEVLADVVQHPAFPSAEVERQRAARLGDLLRQRDEPAHVAAAAAAGALYGPRHPYGYGQLGTEQAIRAVTRDDLAGFWRRHYLPSNAALIVAGAITRDELQTLAAARFGAWPRGSAEPAAPGDAAPSKARLVVVDKPGAPQTALRVTTLAASRKTPDYAAMQVMNAALGGLFSSRINLNLREDKGYSYGVFSNFRYNRTPGPFSIAGSVRTDVTGASALEIFKEVRGMRERALPPDELAGARDSQVYSLPGQFETNAGVGASLAETWMFDLPPDYWRGLPDQFRRVTAAQVQAAAGKYLRPDVLKVIAVGDRAKILPQLQPLNLGQPELRDADGQLP